MVSNEKYACKNWKSNSCDIDFLLVSFEDKIGHQDPHQTLINIPLPHVHYKKYDNTTLDDDP